MSAQPVPAADPVARMLDTYAAGAPLRCRLVFWEMTMVETKWLTKAQYASLTGELHERTEKRRPEIAHLVDAARREGDLRENGGYHAARNEQALNESRIQELESLLKDAQVGATPADDGVVEPGMVVTATIAGRKERFLLGSRDAGGNLGVQVFSPTAPLGRALLGQKRGNTVSYAAPNGSQITVEILDCVPYRG